MVFEKDWKHLKLKCSKCGKDMTVDDGWIDMFRANHRCFDCMIKQAHQMTTETKTP